jgi:drug/metabolite transporter (DMT)-like permease
MPVALIELPDVAMPGVLAVVAIAVLGMLATGYATILYFRLIQGPGPAFLSLVNYLVPAWAVIAGTVVLGESISFTVLIGLALILAGIALSEFGGRIGPSMKALWPRDVPPSAGTVTRKDA